MAQKTALFKLLEKAKKLQDILYSNHNHFTKVIEVEAFVLNFQCMELKFASQFEIEIIQNIKLIISNLLLEIKTDTWDIAKQYEEHEDKLSFLQTVTQDVCFTCVILYDGMSSDLLNSIPSLETLLDTIYGLGCQAKSLQLSNVGEAQLIQIFRDLHRAHELIQERH
jgi:hypothetical protein